MTWSIYSIIKIIEISTVNTYACKKATPNSKVKPLIRQKNL